MPHCLLQAFSLRVSGIARRLIFGLRSLAELLDVGLGLFRCLVDVLANFRNGLVIARRLYVDD
jgi:hypothetical protein